MSLRIDRHSPDGADLPRPDRVTAMLFCQGVQFFPSRALPLRHQQRIGVFREAALAGERIRAVAANQHVRRVVADPPRDEDGILDRLRTGDPAGAQGGSVHA